jgi:hypothetical protein
MKVTRINRKLLEEVFRLLPTTEYCWGNIKAFHVSGDMNGKKYIDVKTEGNDLLIYDYREVGENGEA